MNKVANPISKSDQTSIGFRPILSPKWAKTTPPKGRAMNPTEKVANAASVPVSGAKFGKKSWLKTSAAAVP